MPDSQVLYGHYDGNMLQLIQIYRYSVAQTLKLYCNKGRGGDSSRVSVVFGVYRVPQAHRRTV